MERDRARYEQESERAARRNLVRACAECGIACLVGLVVMGSAFHVNDGELGKGLLYGGLAVGYGGIGIALWRAYRRAEADGTL
jgi:hypothetical protein